MVVVAHPGLSASPLKAKNAQNTIVNSYFWASTTAKHLHRNEIWHEFNLINDSSQCYWLQ
jgi:hypothetical protein